MLVKTALRYSRLSLAILVIDISFGHSASQAPTLEHLPKPSASICLTILMALLLASGLPCGS